jgi:nucleoside-diphosphate-sugar epimerase
VILKNYFELLNVKIIRFFFVYGKNQKRTMLIPRLIDRVKNEESISLQGIDGMSINPVHAYDAAKAIIASLQMQGSSILNVGGPQILSLKKISEIIGKAVEKNPRFIIDENAEPTKLVGDITKLTALIKEPLISFEEGIKTLI